MPNAADMLDGAAGTVRRLAKQGGWEVPILPYPGADEPTFQTLEADEQLWRLALLGLQYQIVSLHFPIIYHTGNPIARRYFWRALRHQIQATDLLLTHKLRGASSLLRQAHESSVFGVAVATYGGVADRWVTDALDLQYASDMMANQVYYSASADFKEWLVKGRMRAREYAETEVLAAFADFSMTGACRIAFAFASKYLPYSLDTVWWRFELDMLTYRRSVTGADTQDAEVWQRRFREFLEGAAARDSEET